MLATISIILDTRRMKQKTGVYPTKLLVVFKGDSKRYQTIYDLTREEFNNLWASRVSEKNKPIRDSLKQLQRQGEEIIGSMMPFSFKDFEREFVLHHPDLKQRKAIIPATPPLKLECDLETYKQKFPIFKNPVPPPGSLLSVFLVYIDRLLKEHRIATATHYQTAYNNFAKFKGNVFFTEISVDYLKEFEARMLGKGYSITTIGIYTRCLRAMFNEADFLGIIKKERCYPFGRRKYRVPNSRNIKKALLIGDVEKIYNYQPECKQEKWAKDMWLFSYFGNGINTKDIAHLKWQNIDEDFIVFTRAKTENATKQHAVAISIFITDDLKRIINEWGTEEKNPDSYIFPIMKPEMSALSKYKQLGLFICSINSWMAKIKKKLGIDRKVTTYVARHTFSTVLKRAGVSTEYIKEALGHTSIQTTETYLDSFEKEIKKEYAKKLIDFKKHN